MEHIEHTENLVLEDVVESVLSETKFFKSDDGVRIKKDPHSNLNHGGGWAGKGGIGGLRRYWGDGTRGERAVSLAGKEATDEVNGVDSNRPFTDFDEGGNCRMTPQEIEQKLKDITTRLLGAAGKRKSVSDFIPWYIAQAERFFAKHGI